MIGIGGMNCGENIIIHLVAAQELCCSHHPVEGGLSGLVHSVGIMKLSRPVQGQPYEKVVLPEKFAPFVIQQGAIGLHGVLNGHPRTPVLLLILYRSPEKVQAH